MRGIHLRHPVLGGLWFLFLAASVFADAQLDAAQKTYGDADDRILRESTQEKDRLLDNYYLTLEQTAQELQHQGRLDDYLAAKKELARLALERTVPPASASELTGDLAGLQGTAGTGLERIQKNEDQRRFDLAGRYLDFLDRRVRQMTIDGQIDAAKDANIEKKRVEAIHAELSAKIPPPPEPAAEPAPAAASRPSLLPADALAQSGDIKRRTAFRPPPKDLELCLTFEKGLADRIKSPKITWQNATEIEDGRFGQGCRFDGNGKITIESIPVPEEGTWCIWARISPSAGLVEQMSIIDANGMGFYVANGELNCAFYDGKSPLVGKTEPVKGAWMHLAVTWGNGERRFYADGNLVSTVGYSGKPWAAKRTMQIGTRWTGAERYFMGDVDELLIYSRCLSPEEVALIAAKDGGGSPALR